MPGRPPAFDHYYPIESKAISLAHLSGRCTYADGGQRRAACTHTLHASDIDVTWISPSDLPFIISWKLMSRICANTTTYLLHIFFDCQSRERTNEGTKDRYMCSDRVYTDHCSRLVRTNDMDAYRVTMMRIYTCMPCGHAPMPGRPSCAARSLSALVFYSLITWRRW